MLKKRSCLFLVILLVFLLGCTLNVSTGKVVRTNQIAANNVKIASGDETRLFPSARTFIPLMMTAERYGDLNETMIGFWVSHYEILVDARPYEAIKSISPNTKDLNVDSVTYGSTYDYDHDFIKWGGLQEIYNWVHAHWTEYAWSQNFNSADAAFEDCFLHVKEPINATFVMNATIQAISAYNPQNPNISRFPGPWDINYDWMMNLGSQVYISYWQDNRTAELSKGLADGFFSDSTGLGWPQIFVPLNKSVEYSSEDDYESDMRSLVDVIRIKLHTLYPEKKLAINNYDHFEEGVEPPKCSFEDNVDIMHREGSIRYSKATEFIEREIGAISRAGSAGKIVLMQHAANFCVFTDQDCVARDRMAGLAAYYLAMNDNVYFLSFGGGLLYSADPRIYSWFNAIGYNIGQPVGNYYVFAQGSDPSRPTTTYKVLARNFTGGLVLLKPRPDWTPGTNYYDASRTTHLLNGVYRPLYANGTLGGNITSITLRNWEGAILLSQTGMVGDVNLDMFVDVADLALVASDFGNTPLTYDTDVNADGNVNILDLVLVGKNFS